MSSIDNCANLVHHYTPNLNRDKIKKIFERISKNQIINYHLFSEAIQTLRESMSVGQKKDIDIELGIQYANYSLINLVEFFKTFQRQFAIQSFHTFILEAFQNGDKMKVELLISAIEDKTKKAVEMRTVASLLFDKGDTEEALEYSNNIENEFYRNVAKEEFIRKSINKKDFEFAFKCLNSLTNKNEKEKFASIFFEAVINVDVKLATKFALSSVSYVKTTGIEKLISYCIYHNLLDHAYSLIINELDEKYRPNYLFQIAEAYWSRNKINKASIIFPKVIECPQKTTLFTKIFNVFLKEDIAKARKFLNDNPQFLSDKVCLDLSLSYLKIQNFKKAISYCKKIDDEDARKETFETILNALIEIKDLSRAKAIIEENKNIDFDKNLLRIIYPNLFKRSLEGVAKVSKRRKKQVF